MPMRPEHSLRSRLFLGIAGIALFLVTAFGLAFWLFIDVLEDELLVRVVRMELSEMPEYVARGQSPPDPVAGDLHRWTVPVDDPNALPARLRQMPEGIGEIEWDDGTEVFAGKLVANGRIHAVVAEIDEIERLERRLVEIGIATATFALLLSLLIAAWLARVVLQPITLLVSRLRELDPASLQPVLSPDLQTAEVRLIAIAMDDYQARIAHFVGREKALTDDISHELRTPNSVIATAAELLLDDRTVAGPARDRVERIARAARRMGSVVSALLYLGREESSQDEVVDLRDVVRDTVDMYRPVALAKGVDLLAVCDHEVRLAVSPGMAAIVLQNLLENALRFTEHGSVRVILESSALRVEDTGVGLAGVDRSRIFERGYRSDASRGSGLGLDLIRRVCARVGWQVAAHQRPAGGTRFEVRFNNDGSA